MGQNMNLGRGILRGSFALFACAWLGACEDLREFQTDSHHVFRGEVIGSGDEKTSFIRQGFASHTLLEMTFDPVVAAEFSLSEPGTGEPLASPGSIDTFTCPENATPCRASQREPGAFDHAALEPIENLAHDALSQYDFPGGGRVKNYIFGARFQSQVDERMLQRHAMVFLSLMETGRAEVRVIAPSALATDGKRALAPALFGVFMLEMHER